MKRIMEKLDSKNYRKLLGDYYQELKLRVAEKQRSDRELKRWDRGLIAVLKFPSPKKETEFVQAVLAMERLNLRQAA